MLRSRRPSVGQAWFEYGVSVEPSVVMLAPGAGHPLWLTQLDSTRLVPIGSYVHGWTAFSAALAVPLTTKNAVSESATRSMRRTCLSPSVRLPHERSRTDSPCARPIRG